MALGGACGAARDGSIATAASHDLRLSAREPLLATLPAIALLVVAHAGGFSGGAAFWPRLAALGVLATLSLLGARRWRDPLGIVAAGAREEVWLRAAAWLPIACVAVSLALSPVARAGYALVALSPLLLLAPAGAARLWPSDATRRIGLLALCVALAAVSAEALVRMRLEGHPRAAMPLGHHNLLALWLLLLLPLSVAALAAWRSAAVGDAPRPPGGARLRGVAALVSATALVLGVAALLATGSLAGGIGLLVEAAFAGAFLARSAARRLRLVAVAAVPILLLALAWCHGPRITEVAAGRDPSLRVRAAYGSAGLRGFLERPLLGWGPGSSSWTLHEHLRPVPGVQPAHELVTDLHSLPLEVLYEGGLVCALVTLALLVLVLRACGVAARQGAAASAAAVALIGAGVASIGSGLFDVLALPFTAAVVYAIVLSAAPPAPPEPLRQSWPLAAILSGAALLLVPDLHGHWHYDRARSHIRSRDLRGVQRELEAAVRADPRFPLYRFRLALLPAETATGSLAFEAARSARGVAALWLHAGARGDRGDLDDPAATRLRTHALERACELDPFGALAPAFLAELTAAGGDPVADGAPAERAALLFARAFAADPRVAASPAWDRTLLERARGAIERVESWPLGWRDAAARELRRLALESATVSSGDELVDLAIVMDREGATSLSLYAFRRLPWSAVVAALPVRAEVAQEIDLPPLFTIEDAALPRWQSGCRFVMEDPRPD